MPCPRPIYFGNRAKDNDGGLYMRVVILGASLDAMCAAHALLDATTKFQIEIVTERAEIGLMGEVPGLFSSWPPCPVDWISDMASQTPDHMSTAVRGSWFVKAMGIQLSKRGCIFHLRSRVTNVDDTNVQFVGAGTLGKSRLEFDHIVDLRPRKLGGTVWHGIVSRIENTPEMGLSGRRSDGTNETWSKDRHQGNKTAIQEMTWIGDNPTSFISSEIERGIQIAHDISNTTTPRRTVGIQI